jgi:hypothetical protein
MDGSPVTWVPYSHPSFDYASTVQDIDDPPDGELEYTMTRTTNVSDNNDMYAFTTDVDAQNVSIRTQVRLIQRDLTPIVSGGVVARVTLSIIPMRRQIM